jgi:glutamate/tyrosine decarboxylase-like PLP-dependent enzyme
MDNLDQQYRGSLDAAARHALTYLTSLDDRPVAATAKLAEIRERLGKPLAVEGMDPQQVIEELARDAENGLHATSGGRFFAWVIGGTLPAALAADWLTAAWDQNAAMHTTGPAAAVVEEIVGAWLKEMFGLPAGSGFALVTGCQMAHVTCLAAARHALLERRGWDVDRRGLSGAPAIRIVAGERHGTVDRAARLLGIGLDHIASLACDDQGRLLPSALERALAGDRDANQVIPTIVLVQAGDINTGVYDRFAEISEVAHRHDAWVHVDGAIGLWAAASPDYRHLTSGLSQADSWATDGHKWLNVPYDCGYAFVADAAAQRAAMSHQAPYLTYDSGARDEMDWNPEWSRRSRGFATYAALRQLGRNGVAAMIERCCRHAHALVTGIGALPGAELAWEPVINQGLVRFLDTRPGATEADHARRTEQVIAAILASGEAFFGPSTWRGKRVMRVSVSSWQTTHEDVERVVRAVKAVLGR